MKKILLVSFAVICLKSYGQQLEYNFSKSTSAYSELTSPIVVNTAWTQTFGAKLPFQFTYFGKAYDSLRITPNSVNFTTSQADFIAMGQEDYYFDGQLYPVGSEISYLITGNAPNRIIKAQFKNMRAVTTDTGYEYTVNNQIWLYETSNLIEFHFGPNINKDINITNYYFGFLDADNSPYYAISGTVASPTLVRVTNVSTFKGLSAHPSSGTVYTFTPYVPSTHFTDIFKPYSFSNTPESFTYRSAQSSSLSIIDLSGRQVMSVLLDANSEFKADYSLLSRGMYLLKINAENQIFTEKILVQ
jgi:hypothetical protein